MPDTIQHKTKLESNAHARAQLHGTIKADKWMVVCWVYDGEKLTLARTTYNFPTGEFQEAVRGLGDALMEEAGTIPAMPGPLPMAAGINLGDRNEAVSGNGSPRVAQAAGRIAGDHSGEARPSTDED